jgi:D-alanyl-D-alanine carboxypeptidase (penicillin-binding protein 5/6)
VRRPARAAALAALIALSLQPASRSGARSAAETPRAQRAQAASQPKLNAAAGALIDARDGHVLYASNANSQRPIASATKLMTALLVLEELPLDRALAAAPYRPDAAESVINLGRRERMKVDDLLRALLLESANDAAVTLARGAAGSQERFVRLMNRKAASLGLDDTRYANPIGLDDPHNYSSANDLAKLTRVLMRDEFFRLTVRMPSARLLSGSFPRTIENRNDLVGKYRWITGVKTGRTEGAGYVLVGSGTRKGADLISVVLDAPSERVRNASTLTLLNYGFSRYRLITPLRAGAADAKSAVKYFSGDAELTTSRTVRLAIRRSQNHRLRIDAPSQLTGPIDEGERVGTATVLVDGKRRATVPLVTAERVPGAGFPRKLAHHLARPWLLLAVAVLLVVAIWRGRRKRAAAEAARRRRRAAARLD